MKKYLLYTIFLLSTAIKIYSQTDTSFWFAAPYIDYMHANSPVPYWGGQPCYFRIATAVNFPVPVAGNPLTDTLHNFTTVIIQQPANQYDPIINPTGFKIIKFNLNYLRQNKTIDLSPFMNYRSSSFATLAYTGINVVTPKDTSECNTVLNKGFNIISTQNITVYYDIDNAWNSELYSLKGKNALGTEFYTSFQNLWGNDCRTGFKKLAWSTINIVATEDNTHIQIYPSQNVYPTGMAMIPVTLKKGQTYVIKAPGQLGPNHLAGTHITSDKPIGITGSDDSVNATAGCGAGGGADACGDQLIPTSIIGTQYIVMRGQVKLYGSITENVASGERVFVMSTQPNTKIWVIDTIAANFKTTLLAAGQTYVWEIKNNATLIKANKPVYVWHIAGFVDEFGGAQVPSIQNCTGSLDVSFVRSNHPNSDGWVLYLNIMVQNGYQQYFMIDKPDGTTDTLRTNPIQWEVVPGTNPQWVVLKANSKNFSNLINPGQVYKIRNTKHVFHLGLINGKSGTTCKYGYFSSFGVERGSASVTNNGADAYQGCFGDSIFLNASGGIAYAWGQGTSIYLNKYLNDSTLANPIATPPPGLYDYHVNIERSCLADTNILVKVAIAPRVIPKFNVDITAPCSPYTKLKITNQSNVDTLPKYYWYFTNNSDSDKVMFNKHDTSFYYIYPRNQSKTPQYYYTRMDAVSQAYTSCSESVTQKITIFPEINASITPDSIQGCSPVTQTFGNLSSGNIAPVGGFLWNFGDVSSSTDSLPTHVFTNPYGTKDSVYYVSMILTSPYYCHDTAYSKVRVHPYTEPDFAIDTVRGCSPLTIRIQNKSKGPISSYYWDFGDGTFSATSAASFTKVYTNAGTTPVIRNLILTIKGYNGTCQKTQTRSITVYPEVNLSITPASNVTGCTPQTVNFTSTISPTVIQYYNWTFGDSGTSVLPSPTHIYINNGNTDIISPVRLITTTFNGCRDTANTTITTTRFFKANFTLDKTDSCADFTVNITSPLYNSLSPTTIFSWDYGDGTAAPANPKLQYYSHLYINHDDTVRHYKLKLKVSSGSCSDSLIKTITVYPMVQAMATATALNDCNPKLVTFNNNTKPGLLCTYVWDFKDGATSTDVNPFHTFNNLTGLTDTFEVTLTATTPYQCSNTLTQKIIVYPYIKANFSVDTAKGCSPFTVGINNATLPGIQLYHWNYGYNGSDTAENNSNTNISHKYPINNNANPVSYRLLLKVSNTGNCWDTISRYITIYPLVTSKFNVDTQGCHSYLATFTNQSKHADYYTWTFGDGNSSTSTANSVSNTYYNWGTKDTIETAKLTATSKYTCTASYDTTMLIKYRPKSQFTVSKYSNCPPFTDTLKNNSAGSFNQYMWNFDIGKPDSIVAALKFTRTFDISPSQSTPQTYRISLRAISSTGCWDDDTISIQVYPKVTALISKDTSKGCNPVTINFKNNTNQAIANSFTWNFGDQTGSTSNATNISHQYSNLNPGDAIYNVSLAAWSLYNCTDTARTQITVYPFISANFSVDTAKGCSPFTTSINSYQPGGIAQYNWDFGDGTTVTKPNNNSFTHPFPINNNADSTKSNPVSYTVKLMVQNHIAACQDSFTRNIMVYPLVTSKFNVDTSECTPFTAKFTNLTRHADTYTWLFGDGGSSQVISPKYTYNNWDTIDHSFTATLTAKSIYNCYSVNDTTIWVRYRPKANFFETDNIYEHCPPFIASFTNKSTGQGSSYTWSIDGVNVSSLYSFKDTFSIPVKQSTTQTYIVNLKVTSITGGCFDNYSIPVRVYPQVTVGFNSPKVNCTPFKVQFTDTSTNVRDYLWTFGDGKTSQEQNPFNNYYNYTENDTIFPVKLIANSLYGCVDSVKSNITVNHMPKSIFNLPVSDSCPPFNATLVNNSFGENDTYLWTFGDNTIPNFTTDSKTTFRQLFNISQADSTLKSYIISLKATNKNNSSCTNSSSTTINVFPQVTALFAPDTAGCNPVIMNFRNSTKNADNFYWKFGDGNISGLNNPTNRFVNTSVNDSIFTVLLKGESQYGCTDSTTHTVKVYPAPDAEFSVLPSLKVYPDATFSILNETNQGFWNYTWNLGDGSPETNVEEPGDYTYGHWGIYTISLNAADSSNKCKSSVSHTITIVAPKPIAAFDSTCHGCVPYTTKFFNSSKYGNTYLWNFGDSSKYEGYNPGEHTFQEPGIYHVKLTVNGDGGINESYQTVTVFQKPVVSFDLSPDTAMLEVSGKTAQAMIKCYNVSKYGTSYLWKFGGKFGDTATSAEYQPVHYYKSLGLYTVSLKVWTENACSDSLTKTVLILGEGKVEFPNAFRPAGSGSNGGYYGDPPYTKNDVFHPYWEGIEEFKLEIFTRWGQKIFESNDIKKGWDGYFEGKICKQDVYVWKAQGKFSNGRSFTKAGDITLLR